MQQGAQWERMELSEVRDLLATDFTAGLSPEVVTERHALYGKNVFASQKEGRILGRILHQFKSPLIFILLIAGVVTVLFKEWVESAVIAAALLVNVLVGTFQEERASRAFATLNRSQARRAVVMRGGGRTIIPAEELVPGDIVLLEGGYYVPADVRLLEEKDLQINESALTGEWVGVVKEIVTLETSVPLAERRNMAWMGTLVESGYGKGVVVATGAKTEVGKIAEALGIIEGGDTPLQRNVRHIARFLTVIIAIAVAVIFLLGLIRGETFVEMFMLAVAVAVATVPSGLPIAVTVVLALGMEAILRRGGLVRNLLAAETLGATTVVLTDKTGTLTQAKMHLADIVTFDRIAHPKEEITTDEPQPSWIETLSEDARAALSAAVLATDAFVEEGEDAPRKLTVHGRPIEKAIVVAGLEAGISPHELAQNEPRIDYLRFESRRRFGGSLNGPEDKVKKKLTLTGAPDVLLAQAHSVLMHGKKVRLTNDTRAQFMAEIERMSEQGMRLIGVSQKDVTGDPLPEEHDVARADLLKGTTLLGALAFMDPIREDVPEAIKAVQGANIDVIMVTGDSPQTARTIAKEVGIIQSGDELVVRGDELEPLSDDELYEKLKRTRVIARALPAHKMRLVNVLKSHGEVVAMTGDGVNDAPALQAASIGVAVGAGTEVAKEASDLILIDNSFSIILAAIEEGRRIIDNLKKILAYLLSGSFSEIFVITGALLMAAPLPLLPTQILWTKIVEEGLMSFSFAFEKKDKFVMKRDPREVAATTVLTAEIRTLIMAVTVITGGFLVALYFILLSMEIPIDTIRTIMFAAISLDTIFFTFSLKSFDQPLWRINPFSNRFLLVALVVSIALLIVALTFPPLMNVLSLTPLMPWQIAIIAGIGVFNLFTIETLKYVLFKWRERNPVAPVVPAEVG